MKRKIVLTFLIVSLSISVHAQQYSRGMRWGGGIDYDKFQWGFNLSYVGSSLKIFKEKEWQDAVLPSSNKLESIRTPFTNGYGFGLLGGVKMHENLNLYFSPTVLFADQEVQFSYSTSNVPDDKSSLLLTKELKASLLDLPLTVKFKSHRKKNYAIYLLGGGKYTHNIVSRKKMDDGDFTDSEKLLKLKSGFFSYEAGIGVDIYFEYFKMSPELKWSQSVGDVLDKRNENTFNEPIDKMLLRSIQFSLIFQ